MDIRHDDGGLAEAEFVRRLRDTVSEYLGSLDAWEQAYEDGQRKPGTSLPDPPVLAEAHRRYVTAWRQLAAMVPQARRMCVRYGIRNPWPAFIRSRPSIEGPRNGGGSGVGRNERMAISECLTQLSSACAHAAGATPAHDTGGVLRRLRQYFW
jgi:hypothetical protein